MAKFINSHEVMSVEYHNHIFTNVPIEIKYIAQDDDGDINGFESQPEFSSHTGCWGVTDGTMGYYLGSYPPGDYLNSCEEIPLDFSTKV